MAMLRSTSGTTRAVLVCFTLLLSVVFVLPTQSRHFFQKIGQPFAQILAVPIQALARLDKAVRDIWEGYIALHVVYENNQHLKEEIQELRRENSELRERATSSERLAELLAFKETVLFQTIAAQIIGRDASNWYRGVVLNKGEQDGVTAEMGVILPAGVVGRVVKTTTSTAMVLLVTDPHNAITGLIQRTRDEGIIEGMPHGRLRMKYLPLLSSIEVGDRVVTSGLTGEFPKGLMIGTITRVDKVEGELFQSAEILPDVDLSRLEEVLVVTSVMMPADRKAGTLPNSNGIDQQAGP
jgi:rod shape-determining protein MreC